MNSSINEPVYSTLGPIADNLLWALAPPANRTLITPDHRANLLRGIDSCWIH